MRTLCYMCAHCVTCAVHIVLHVRFVRVTCAHIVLHVRTLCYMCAHCVTCAVCEGHMCAHCVTCAVHIVLHVLHMRIVRVTRVKCAHIVLYHNERFGIVKISRYFSYKVKFDIKTFAGTH